MTEEKQKICEICGKHIEDHDDFYELDGRFYCCYDHYFIRSVQGRFTKEEK